MRHPDISDWTDYVRAMDSEDDHAVLQSHLDEGCGSCRALVSTLQRVTATAEADAAVAPPASAVRSVKAFFRLQQRGQLVETHGKPRSCTPVFPVGDGEVIERTISERHGAFEMTGPLDHSSELWVFPDDQNRIRLSLESRH